MAPPDGQTISPKYTVERAIEGRLQAIIVHGMLTANLHDAIWGDRVSCELPEELKPHVLKVADKRVLVTGVVRTDAAGRPRDVRVKTIQELPGRDELPQSLASGNVWRLAVRALPIWPNRSTASSRTRRRPVRRCSPDRCPRGEGATPAASDELKLATQIARLRREAGLSQAELALRIGTQQAGVARMERRTHRGYTVGTLAKIAAATGARLEVRLVPGPGRGVAARSSNDSPLHGGRG